MMKKVLLLASLGFLVANTYADDDLSAAPNPFAWYVGAGIGDGLQHVNGTSYATGNIPGSSSTSNNNSFAAGAFLGLRYTASNGLFGGVEGGYDYISSHNYSVGAYTGSLKTPASYLAVLLGFDLQTDNTEASDVSFFVKGGGALVGNNYNSNNNWWDRTFNDAQGTYVLGLGVQADNDSGAFVRLSADKFGQTSSTVGYTVGTSSQGSANIKNSPYVFMLSIGYNFS